MAEYYPPVAPVVPDAQRNIAPELMLRGLASLAQMAVAREKAQLDAEQMITDSGLKSRQLDIARENNLLDYKLKSDLLPLQQDLLKAHADSFRSTARAQATNDTSWLQYRQNMANEVADFNDELRKRDLLNPNPKNPMQAYADYADLANEFQNAQIPQIQGVLTGLKARFEEMKVPLAAFGASPDPNDPKKWVGGAPKQFSPGQIIAHLQDPATNQLMTNSLRASGVIVPTEKTKTQSGDEVVTGYKAAPWFQSWIDQAQGVTMKPHSEPRPAISRMSKWMVAAGFGNDRTGVSATSEKIRVMSPQGQTGLIPATQLDAALKAGYKQIGDTPAAGVDTIQASRDGRQAVPASEVGEAAERLQSDGTTAPNDSTDDQ